MGTSIKRDHKIMIKKTETNMPKNDFKDYIPAIASFAMLMSAIIIDNFLQLTWFNANLRVGWYVIAYLLVGMPVIINAVKAILKKDVFSEFFLMSIATLGAFSIGEYPEAVAVMLFYTIGELFQSAAIKRAKGNIKALLDVRPDSANVLRNEIYTTVQPESISIGETIQVKAGEKVPLDGILLSKVSSFNTAALTGESKPNTLEQGEIVLAGMINLGGMIEIEVTKIFAESSIARILDMVQNASSRKAQTELFIRKFARVYTPIVVALAALVVVLPYFFVSDYIFTEWLYRALIFLVISCPCALVISIPLGYFGGIGAASRNGILFKGSNYLDQISIVNTVFADKTGTLTKGVFKVQHVKTDILSKDEFIALAVSIEANSTHPIAKAIVQYGEELFCKKTAISDLEEIPGHGLKGVISGDTILTGNSKLLKKFNVIYPEEIDSIVDSIVLVAKNGTFLGYIIVADEIKADAKKAVDDLHSMNIQIIMLSGDKQAVVNDVANKLGIKYAYGDLLPLDKVEKVEKFKSKKSSIIAFVGDGINDAPVLALSDIGIAMGGLGSDAAIESADVVIQTDHPSKISTAIRIGKATKKIVWQNIILAFSVKAIILALGAGGLASMWEAVFADVGVALLAILNAVRIQKIKF
jgi:Cd2+/Zn2+-exporting ATPase